MKVLILILMGIILYLSNRLNFINGCKYGANKQAEIAVESAIESLKKFIRKTRF